MEIRKILELNIFKELKLKKYIKEKIFFGYGNRDELLFILQFDYKNYTKHIYLKTTIKDIQKFIDLSLIDYQKNFKEYKIFKLFEKANKKEKLKIKKENISENYWFLKNDDLWTWECPICNVVSDNEYNLDCKPNCITWKNYKKNKG